MSERHHRVVALGFVLAMTTVAASAGCASTEGQQTETSAGRPAGKTTVGTPMPSIAVSLLEGKKRIALGAPRDKVVLVDIWASWCAPCMEELPMLDDLAGRLQDRGVEIIAISIDEDKDSARTFLETRKHWRLTLAHDPKGKLPDLLQPAKMPTSYVVDRAGIVRYVNEGFSRDDIKRLERRLTNLAEEKS